MPDIGSLTADGYDRTLERALVVFSGETDIKWLRCLKPGFRHCCVILRASDRWIVIDPLAHMTRIALQSAADSSDIAGLLQEKGLRIIETPLREAEPVMTVPMLCTCVELVKRILGIQCWSIITPWQLYRYLRQDPASILIPARG